MPFLVHAITVPATFIAGFFLGWLLRGAALKRGR